MSNDSHSQTHPACAAPQAPLAVIERDANFLALVPRIRRQAAYYLRHLSAEERAEAVQEVVASAFVSWVRLQERGQAERAFAGPLARYGANRYFAGRRVGSRMNRHDVTSACCHHKQRVSIERLDQFDARLGDWQEVVVEDRHATPADVATVRVDFAAWLETLPERTRRVAETLALGEATGCVARMFGLSSSRISQLRRELYLAWCIFQGEAIPATASALA